jgi:pSer/pThr/pTyr-binding forkhead associated (FHA) protein
MSKQSVAKSKQPVSKDTTATSGSNIATSNVEKERQFLQTVQEDSSNVALLSLQAVNITDDGQPILSGKIPQYIVLKVGKTTVGRGSTCDVILNAQKENKFIISRNHAIFTISRSASTSPSEYPYDCLLEDCGAVNGTYVNGLRIHRCQVKEKDEIQFGGMCDIPEGYLLQQSDVSVKYMFNFLSVKGNLPATDEGKQTEDPMQNEKQFNPPNEKKKKTTQSPLQLDEETKNQQCVSSSSLKSVPVQSDKSLSSSLIRNRKNELSVSSSLQLNQNSSYPQLQLQEKQVQQLQQRSHESSKKKKEETVSSSSSSHKRSLSLTVSGDRTATTTNSSMTSSSLMLISEDQANLDIDRLSLENEGNHRTEGSEREGQNMFPSPSFRSSLPLPSVVAEEVTEAPLSSSNHQKTKRAKLDNSNRSNVGVDERRDDLEVQKMGNNAEIMNEKRIHKDEVEMVVDSTTTDKEKQHSEFLASSGDLAQMKDELHQLKSFQEKELNEIKQQLQLLLSSSSVTSSASLSLVTSDTTAGHKTIDKMRGRKKNDEAFLETVMDVDEENGEKNLMKKGNENWTIKTLHVESEEEKHIISKLQEENQKLKCLYYIIKLQQKEENGEQTADRKEVLGSPSFSVPDSVTRKNSSKSNLPFVSSSVPTGVQSASSVSTSASSSSATIIPPAPSSPSARSTLPVCTIDLQSLLLQLTCPLCSSLLLDAAVLRCSHGFCRLCIERYIHRETCDSTCPICKDPPLCTSSALGKDNQKVYYRSDQLDNLVWIVLQASSEAEVMVRLSALSFFIVFICSFYFVSCFRNIVKGKEPL